MCGSTAAPPPEDQNWETSGFSMVTQSGTARKVPPLKSAACSAANLSRSGPTSVKR